ncbi:response regulator [Estrella lausannensis]|uniref:Two-component system, response regulator n=1 Tax=Estrella lausannensis TaxID=483423 RepID=A0A0H5DSY6_9BACT|nr:response regulator [Estrella lausannensis]CRX39453.1 two-component system, response regulator [Estrella lausannensis]
MNPIHHTPPLQNQRPLKRSHHESPPRRISDESNTTEWDSNPLPRMEDDHEPPPLNSKRAKCLYADDNKLLRTMMSKMLATLDIEADIANEGNEAFELLNKNRGQYSFTIFDMEMGEGEMNGHIAIKRWRQKEEESKMEALPMYILTANSDQSMKSNCLTCGATDVLSKPISREKLKEIVKKHLPPTLPERHSSSLHANKSN